MIGFSNSYSYLDTPVYDGAGYCILGSVMVGM